MSRFKHVLFLIILAFISVAQIKASKLLLPMDESQTNHLKAYGITYWALSKFETEAEWLLNYKGGSFLLNHTEDFENECKIRGVSYQVLTDAESNAIHATIENPEVNMSVVKLLNAPKIAVYSPKTKQPWDDAVTLVLTYAEIPYTVVFDDEVLEGKLPEYDWLHLHHEDFTGQFGKFLGGYGHTAWYQTEVKEATEMAAKHGFKTVRELKLAVVKKIKDFCLGGGFLFAMCSATDTYDIALAAENIDICESVYDGTGVTPDYNSKLDFTNTLAFKDFKVETNPFFYEHSNIDVSLTPRPVTEETDLFTLFDFSAKWDIVPTILCQNHTRTIEGFMGQTTAFKKDFIKSSITIMGENALLNEARYIHGELGKGTFTFFGGHDPEDYQHHVGEPPTDLALHPNSPGYRLILNNILFPSAKKEKLKT